MRSKPGLMGKKLSIVSVRLLKCLVLVVSVCDILTNCAHYLVKFMALRFPCFLENMGTL